MERRNRMGIHNAPMICQVRDIVHRNAKWVASTTRARKSSGASAVSCGIMFSGEQVPLSLVTQVSPGAWILVFGARWFLNHPVEIAIKWKSGNSLQRPQNNAPTT